MASPVADPPTHVGGRARLRAVTSHGWHPAVGVVLAGASVSVVRCPHCSGTDDKVVDSRTADEGSAIRRRRECLECGRRFTTFERVDEQQLVVVKRSGDRMAFERGRIEAGVASAAKGRPVSEQRLAALAAEIEEEVRLEGSEVTTERIGLIVLDRLRLIDEVTYLRFASVYKGFDEAADFERELAALTKATEPKRHSF